MLLLDTNFVIDYLRQNPDMIAFVQQHTKQNLALSPIVVMEIYQGATNKRVLQYIKKELNGFVLLELNQSITELALQLYENYVLSQGLSIPDAFVAATALIYDLELRTFNLKDFRFIPSLVASDSLN